MTSSLRQPELQLRALRLYGELLCRRADWAGQLVLAAFERASGCGLAAAASLVGAASLTVEADMAAVKAHFRDGAFDFVVNTLDEALRAIKNEVRKGRPIAIGLVAEPEAVLKGARERGVAAALVVTEAEASALECGVGAAGAEYVRGDGAESAELRAWLRRRQWAVTELPSLNKAEGEQMFIEDSGRLRWMRDLPKHQRSVRESRRWGWMPAEDRRAVASR